MDSPRKQGSVSDTWTSLLRASRRLDESRQTVLVRCIAGQLVPQIIDGRVVISEASIDKELARRAAPPQEVCAAS